MKYRARIILALAIAASALGGHRPAEAASALSVLSFNSSNYTVIGGQTVQVEVFLSQNSTGGMDTPITAGNGIILAGIQVSFNNPSGVAAVLSPTGIMQGPLFDPGATPSLSATQATLAETSLFSPSGLSSLPLLLGTFTFTGLKVGTTQITVTAIPPLSTPSFTTFQGNNLFPTSATANINVVPEPSSIVLLLTGGPLLLGALALRRSRPPQKTEQGNHRPRPEDVV